MKIINFALFFVKALKVKSLSSVVVIAASLQNKQNEQAHYLISRISIIIVLLIRANNKSRGELAYKRQRCWGCVAVSVK